jgi:hypothetical protein
MTPEETQINAAYTAIHATIKKLIADGVPAGAVKIAVNQFRGLTK